MNKPTLICMVGLSGSGKSTKAKEFAKEYGYKIVSSDQIREQYCGDMSNQSRNNIVFQIFYSKIKYALQNGENVIADATFLTKKDRQTLFDNLKSVSCYKEAYVMNKSFGKCIIDNESRLKNVVPYYIMQKQNQKFVMPTLEEGFEKITVDYCNGKISEYFTEHDQEMNVIEIE